METVDKVLAEKRDKLRAEFKAELEREVQPGLGGAEPRANGTAVEETPRGCARYLGP